MSFEENRGQAEARFNYLARTRLHALLLSSAGAVIAGDGGRAELRFVGGSPAARSFAPEGPSGRVSYFAGNNQRRWIRGVPAYAKVRYQNVYPGIDVVWYGREGRLEFDVIVAPGTDPGAAVLEVRGRAASIDPAGALVLQPAHDHIELRPPIAYQEKDGERRPVHAAWARLGEGRFGFRLAGYDAGRSLVIDPVLVYSSYLGASDSIANAVAADASGNVYIAGETSSAAFGTGSLLRPPDGETEAFVVKLDASGSRLIYAAYLGGNGPDAISGIAIDGEGNAVVAGVTASSNFPTVRPWQAALGGPIDAFAAKINPQGTELLYSTYIGGSATDLASAVAVDAAGSAYVAGYTQSATIPAAPSPTLPGFQRNRAGDSDAFACKLDRDGRPVYATLLGGAAGEQAFGAAVSANGELIVTGVTHSENFPTANALIGSTRAAENVFVTKLTRDGTGLVYSTFLNGDGGGDGLAVAADAAGAAYVTGMAMAGFPTVNPAAPCTAAQAFVAKLSPDGARLEYSTCLGGTNTSIGRAVVVDAAGNAYVAGFTDSGDFPLVDAVQQRIGSDVLFKTNDGGGTWTPAGDGLLNLNITSLLVDPYTSSTLYALTAGGGIAKSTNGAATWQRVNTGLNQEMICGLAMGGPSTLYTSSDLTLYKTTDGAASWQPGAAGIGCVLAASPRAPDVIFASGQPGLLKSVDGGRTFSPAGVGIPAQAYVGVLVIDPSNPEVLYAGTSGHGAFKSTDGGATFSAMNVDSNVFALAVAPSASNIVYAGARFGVYTSKDGGRTWDMPLSAVFDCVYALAVDPGNPSIVYAGTREGGIAKSTNGGTSFSDASDGVSSPRIWTVAIDPSDTSRVYAGAVARDDAFVTKLNASGSRVLLSTFLGGHGNDEAAGLALDSGGAIYVAGTTDSGDLPLVSPRHSKLDDSTDAFLARIDPGGGVAQVACTSGASFAPSAPVAANSIASLWGKELAPSAASAGSLPLPVELAGARVRVIDFSGVERFAPLFFVSPGQINFLVPEGTRPGTASLAAIRDGAIVGMGTVEIAEIAPALFTANSSGRGVPAATAVQVSATGVQTPVRVYDCPSGGGSCVPVPLDVGDPTDQLVLILYGTGIRGRSAGGTVTAVVGGTPAMVLYAGPQADVGVDQVNVVVPRALAGRGEAPLQLSVDGKAANAVTIVVR